MAGQSGVSGPAHVAVLPALPLRAQGRQGVPGGARPRPSAPPARSAGPVSTTPCASVSRMASGADSTRWSAGSCWLADPLPRARGRPAESLQVTPTVTCIWVSGMHVGGPCSGRTGPRWYAGRQRDRQRPADVTWRVVCRRETSPPIGVGRCGSGTHRSRSSEVEWPAGGRRERLPARRQPHRRRAGRGRLRHLPVARLALRPAHGRAPDRSSGAGPVCAPTRCGPTATTCWSTSTE